MRCFPIYRRVSSDLLADIEKWKKTRNDLVHKSCSILFDNEEVRRCAIDGKELVRRISNTARNIKRAQETMNEK